MNPDQQPDDVNPGTSRGIGIARWVGFVLVGLFITGLLAIPIQIARQGAFQTCCDCHFKQLGIALLNYESTYGCLPPAYVADADGKPMHSWRVLILPYLELSDVYKQYDFNEPWNGPNNSKLAKLDLGGIFQCPVADGDATETSYLAVVGPETGWQGAAALKLRDLKHGSSKTIAIVEALNSGVNWLEPRDLTMDEALRGINPPGAGLRISSNHPGGAHIGYFDAHVTFLGDKTPVKNLRPLLSRSGEPPQDPDFLP